VLRVCVCTLMLACGLFLVSGGLVGQEKKKDDKKDPPVKAKGMLPQYWGKLGLSDEQKQNIYKIQGKYNEEIDKLEAKIKDLKATRDKEARAVLTADQRKKLEEILLGKD
jgi:Spy/CpxP family protein refolding chaperone